MCNELSNNHIRTKQTPNSGGGGGGKEVERVQDDRRDKYEGWKQKYMIKGILLGELLSIAKYGGQRNNNINNYLFSRFSSTYI